jgi:hypothetical protein
MRLRRVIPAFILGISIGLITGIGFFAFKINDIFNRMKDAAKGQITVIEQRVKEGAEERPRQKKGERFHIPAEKQPVAVSDNLDSMVRQDEEIKLASDELLSVKTVRLIRVGDKISAPDTTAARLAGVEEDDSDNFTIEFWKTPLNSRGYRFTKNKLMLYGFLDYDNALLYKMENNFYLRSSGQVYRLQFNAEFAQPERVLDTELIARLS